MKWDFEDYLWAGFILLLFGVVVFIIIQMGNMDDCAKRGGYSVDTSQGMVCAKLERV